MTLSPNWPNHSQPLVILAPMDGFTDPAFRRFIKRIEPRSIVFSEFLSAKQVHAKPALADKMFKIYPDEHPVVIQLYGKEPEDFRVAAMLAVERGAAGIDINMGCPAKKVVAHQHGSALLKNIDLACEIVGSVKRSVNVPVTVKTRLGWDDHTQLIPFVKKLEEHGLDAITIHGRTYRQKFDGDADWHPIYALKDALRIPVFGNGDVISAASAKQKLGNLNGVMVGRGAVANPWLMREICNQFYSDKLPEPIDFSGKVAAWKAFAEMAMDVRQEYQASCNFRKYMVRLVKELGLGPDIRAKAVRVSSLAEINAVLDLMCIPADPSKSITKAAS